MTRSSVGDTPLHPSFAPIRALAIANERLVIFSRVEEESPAPSTMLVSESEAALAEESVAIIPPVVEIATAEPVICSSEYFFARC